MPTLAAPDTWTVLQQIQARLQAELLVTDSLVTNAVPLTTLSASDQTKYGATNCILIARPKALKATQYPRQCHLTPINEHVYRRAYGGKIWDELWVSIRLLYDQTSDYYTTTHDLLIARDKMAVILGTHAELPSAPTVEASKQVPSGAQAPIALHYEISDDGKEMVCWGFLWWIRQQYVVPGGIIP